jgi:hypothetical protein
MNSAYVDGVTDAASHWSYGNNINGTTGNTVTTLGGTLYDYILSLDGDPNSSGYATDSTVNMFATGSFSFAGDGTLTWNVVGGDPEPNPTTVPVPAAVWLFGSALLGLAGIARRRETV